jgi:hypothetical protein
MRSDKQYSAAARKRMSEAAERSWNDPTIRARRVDGINRAHGKRSHEHCADHLQVLKERTRLEQDAPLEALQRIVAKAAAHSEMDSAMVHSTPTQTRKQGRMEDLPSLSWVDVLGIAPADVLETE